MKKLALSIPGFREIETPENIPSGVDAPENILQTSLDLLTIIGVIAALIFLLYGGLLWVTSSGDKAKVDRARQTIIYSIIGLVVMILAFVIVQTIGYFIGSSFLSNIGR